MKARKSSSLILMYRWMHLFYLKRISLLPQILMRLIRILFSCDLPYTVKLGENVVLAHNGLGVVIHQDAIIGSNTKICQNVTIGEKNGSNSCPKIGNNVFIGTGAAVMGDIEIGDNSMIGANAVVIDSVPPNAIVVGIPAKIKRFKKKDENIPF